MIPLRIKISGFLSYKDEQEIRFVGSPLWMLSGTNGSGKSSIFDAVTYALFGHHRGGSQNAVELINKDSNTLSVEFDFTVEKQLYRIKRTVRRRTSGVASTQQVMRYGQDLSLVNAAAGDAFTTNTQGASLAHEDSWVAIADTTYKAKFDAWIRDQIGLDYETFTSSVLLLQGKSEKLLDSTPAGRAGVLARIVDLERYQKLHAKSDDKRRTLKGQLEGINNQLLGIRSVTTEELTAANDRIQEVERSRAQVQDRIDSLAALEMQSRRWAEAGAKLASTRAKLATAETLLGHAVAIEKEHTRLQELRQVLPAVGIIVTERGRTGESERNTEKLTAQRTDLEDRQRQSQHALDQARQKLVALKKTLAEDEGRFSLLNARLRELAAILEKVKQVEDGESEVRRLEQEFKPLPADPEAAVRQLQQEHERLVLLAQQVALLERLHQDRSELTKAVAGSVQAKAEEGRLLKEGKDAKEEFDALQERIKVAKEARSQAEEAAAEARALAKQARDLADEFKQLTGAKSCRACGQPLTPEHFDIEKKKRDLDARAAERKLDSLSSSVNTARQTEAEAVAQEKRERERLDKLRDSYRDAGAAVRHYAQDIKRLTESCRHSYFALPDEFKRKIGLDEPNDWSKATYPDRADLSELATQIHGLESVKRKLKQAQDEAKKVQTLRARLDSAREGLQKAKQGLTAGDPAALRQEFAAKQSAETTVTASIKATKREIEATDKECERLQRELATLDNQWTEWTGKLNLEESVRKQSAEAIDRARRTLPDPWQKRTESAGLKEQLDWKREFEGLIANGIETKFTQLQAARGALDSLRAEIAEHAAEVESFPESARRSPDDVKADTSAAKKELDQRNRELLEAQRQKGSLDEYCRQRAELNERYKLIDAEFNRYKLLTELLGRDRLQRFLVRKAERQIVDYANGVLDRLSSGQLFLRLVGAAEGEGSAEKALELECANQVTGGAAINVAFLSGSQRFRVAVALALGIGQYASKQHRPLESVIIDEGFGCLDRAGRQVMIEELQNLRGHLHCILLVSHQEEFADAFPDGYRFELHDGATKVSRFVR
jgi:exonuclease SbcC